MCGCPDLGTCLRAPARPGKVQLFSCMYGMTRSGGKRKGPSPPGFPPGPLRGLTAVTTAGSTRSPPGGHTAVEPCDPLRAKRQA
eukprot:6219270-Prymnesium_polylepis.2